LKIRLIKSCTVLKNAAPRDQPETPCQQTPHWATDTTHRVIKRRTARPTRRTERLSRRTAQQNVAPRDVTLFRTFERGEAIQNTRLVPWIIFIFLSSV
jgi:hypothetical protein